MLWAGEGAPLVTNGPVALELLEFCWLLEPGFPLPWLSTSGFLSDWTAGERQVSTFFHA
jgi:hypothetical protein